MGDWVRAGLISTAVALALAVPDRALAQADASVDAANSAPPINLVPHNASQEVARSMLASLLVAERQRDLCWQLGCLVIVNESKSFQVAGFYVATAGTGDAARWSSNQFGMALLPQRATFRFKTGSKDCQRPVRFVLRHPATRERLSIDAVANLCSSPHVDSLIRINANHPEVIVGG
jgi:hypothetical protein